MKRLWAIGLGILAAAMLSGCSPTLHPVVTAQLQGQPGGYGLLIGGTGFSPTNPCASVVLIGYPQSGTITPINPQMPCNSGSFSGYVWPVPVATCPAGVTSPIQAAVLAVDHKTFDPAQAIVSVPCTAPLLCPTTLKGSQLPTVNWSQASTAPGYYAYQSAILNSNNGSPLATTPSLGAIKTAMGGLGPFDAATFTVPNGTNGYGTGGGLPTGVISCSYDSPQFTYQKQPAKAQVTVACTTTCGSL